MKSTEAKTDERHVRGLLAKAHRENVAFRDALTEATAAFSPWKFVLLIAWLDQVDLQLGRTSVKIQDDLRMLAAALEKMRSVAS